MSYKEVNFSKKSSIKIGATVNVFIVENSQYPHNHFIVGSANNLLVSQTPPPLLMLSKKFDYIKIVDKTLVIGAATPSGKVVSFCKKNNIKNFEFLSSLPGTLGGIVKMNAGLKEYEIFNNLISLKVDDRVVLKDEVDFAYRYTDIKAMIFEATFELQSGFDESKIELFKNMRANQPKDPSAGSCFKNPPNDSAGRLIEAVGLKGKRIGNMAFSEIHANFLVNLGNGTFNEAIELIELAEKVVFEKMNVKLEREIIVL
ncbi:MAG: UDP-N-acetylmuramate dehydrogenase [Helicobacteraceae bacterium]|nr:UDP-N-acetylmuramate dehydrogenase [Helicobacteraceae bacterium]